MEISKLLLEHGATLNDTQSDFIGDENLDLIEYSLIIKNLDFLEYMLIEKKIKAPEVAITYGDIDPKTVVKMTITEVLESDDYTTLTDDGIKKQAKRIIKYLKDTNQK